MAPRKVTFAKQCQDAATSLAIAADAAADLYSIYFDRGYNSGGADPITDADLEAHEITAAEISSFMSMAENLALFLNNGSPAQSDYDSSLNKLRADR